MLLEVIACSVIDALEAERGGAHRLEIVRDLDCGGLTPPVGLVREILGLVTLPVRVMLRERKDYYAGDEDEKLRLCEAAAEFSELRVDGLVLGFLLGNRLDLEFIAQLLQCAPNLKATFHHAFEEVEPFSAIGDLKKVKQVDRILTHGGQGGWQEKAANLVRYQEAALPEIKILVGGGLDAERISWLSGTANLSEFHVGRAARQPPTSEGRVGREKVSTLVDSIKKKRRIE